jgi:hypothetical protein
MTLEKLKDQTKFLSGHVEVYMKVMGNSKKIDEEFKTILVPLTRIECNLERGQVILISSCWDV